MKTKILAWGDYCVYTGFANVMSNIFKRLTSDALIDVIGINYDGRPDYDHERFPGRVWPARSFVQGPYDDMYGRQKIIDRLREDDYDVFFMLQDTFVVDKMLPYVLEVRKRFKKKFKIVYYYPMDSEPVVQWVKESVSLVDVPVAYSRFGYECASSADPSLVDKIKIIPHGVDFTDFNYIVDRDKVSEIRNILATGTDDKFLLVNINRNTPRKDIPRSLMVLRKLLDMKVSTALYLHMSEKDMGGNFHIVAKQLGLEYGVDYFIPGDLDSIEGYSSMMLNYIYNMADAVMTTSLGEGWGLSLTESMATKTPVIGPNHSSIKELLANDRGLLCDAGNTNSLWRTIDSDNMTLRPLVDVDNMANLIHWLIRSTKDFPEDRDELVNNAYEWVTTLLNWDKIVEEQWKPILVTNNVS